MNPINELTEHIHEEINTRYEWYQEDVKDMLQVLTCILHHRWPHSIPNNIRKGSILDTALPVPPEVALGVYKATSVLAWDVYRIPIPIHAENTISYINLEVAIAGYDIEKYIKAHNDAIPCRFFFTGDSLVNWWNCGVSTGDMYDIAELQYRDTDTQYVLDNNPTLYKALDNAIKRTPFNIIKWEPYELEPCVLNDENRKCVLK